MENIIIENARLLPGSFRNFSGKASQYNAEGNRNFVIALDPDKAHELQEKGWPVKWTPDRYSDDGEMRATMRVNVKYTTRDGRKLIPPKVVVISSSGKVNYTEDMIGLIDTMDISKCDLILSGYEYKTMGREGVSAYLKTAYITMAEDALDLKYRDAEVPTEDIPW